MSFYQTNIGNRSRQDWADDEEFDDPTVLPPQQVISNKDGTKTVISFRFNDDGKKVKSTRKIRTTIIQEHVNPRVAARKSWAKFGLEKGHPAGPSLDTTSVGENITFRPSVNWKSNQKEDKTDKSSMKQQLADKKVKCRICSGDHFTARCPFKDTMAPVDEGGVGAGDLDGDGGGAPDAAGGLGDGKSSYVPPHLRKGAAGAGERMGGKYERDDLATLRVTNVSAFQKAIILMFRSKRNALSRSANSQRRKICEGCLSALVESPGYFWPRIGKPGEQRGLRSSAFKSGQMRHVRARRWMAVSGDVGRFYFRACY